jgi:transposase
MVIPAMKFVVALSEAERATLREALKYGPSARMRQRAQAVYLSSRGYRLEQLAELFEVDRDTVSRWLDSWEAQGLRGLYDAPRAGRPLLLNEAEQQQVQHWVEEEPRQLKQVQARLEAHTGKAASLKTLKRLLKKTTAIAGNAAGAR